MQSFGWRHEWNPSVENNENEHKIVDQSTHRSNVWNLILRVRRDGAIEIFD